MPISVIIADDHALIREGIIQILSASEDIEIAAECSAAEEIYKLSALTKPDIVIMDIKINRSAGIEAAKRIINDMPNIKTIFLTTYEDTEYVKQALETGTAGYVLQHVTGEKLIDIIKQVHLGERIIDTTVFKQIVDSYLELTNPYEYIKEEIIEDITIELTQREQEILYQLIKGMTNKEISTETHLAIDTVKTHLRNIFRKLGVKNRSQATTKGIKLLKANSRLQS